MFGLSYLPTAQRLSFSLVKVNGIKVEKNSEEDLSKFSQISIPRELLLTFRPLLENLDV